MQQHALNQTAPSRAWEDTSKWLLDHIISWFLAFLLPGGGTVLATWLLPSNVSILGAAIYGFIGGLLGLILLFGTTYVFHLILTPYRQRNEARALLLAKPKPISISNRDELLRIIKRVKDTAFTFIQQQEPICQMQRTNNLDHPIAKNAKIEAEKAYANYRQAEAKLQEEIVVAGEVLAPYISSFLELVKFHVCMRYYNADNRPNWVEWNNALEDAFRAVIKIIDVISQ